MSLEFSSARNIAEIETVGESIAEGTPQERFDIYMEDADRSGVGHFAIEALSATHGDTVAARALWSNNSLPVAPPLPKSSQ